MLTSQFIAKSFFVPRSQFKMRPLADSLVRGKRVDVALSLLATSALKKALPLEKLIRSAAANAAYLNNYQLEDLFIMSVKIDQGPTQRYFKPGAQGRANVYRRRFCHLEVILMPIV